MDVNFVNSSGLQAGIFNQSIKQEGAAVLKLVGEAVEAGKEAQAITQSNAGPGVGTVVDKSV